MGENNDEEKVLGMTREDVFWRDWPCHGKVSSFMVTRRSKEMGTDSFSLGT